jgi:HlyD family secretion protein
MKTTIIVLTAISTLVACSHDDDSNRVVGELQSDRIELTVEYAEPIMTIAVAEGDTVKAGQVLLTQDDSRARARLAEADASLLQATARLDELIRGPRSELIVAARANVEGANQELEFRESEQERFSEIHQRGLASAETLDRVNAALDAAQALLKLRLAQLEELLAGTTLEELSQAEQVVKQSEARRDSAQIDLDRHTLKAPVDGVLDSRLFELGERPGIGQPALVVLAASQPYARVYVPEPLRVKVRSGTRARIYVDGLSEPIAGTVRVVASEAAFTPYYALTERDRGRLSYVAKVDVAEDRERLPDGVPVEVEFDLD